LILVSSCLLGISCRYDGESRPSPEAFQLIKGVNGVIPVCPEQLGGLATPRPAARLMGGDGFDVLAGRAKVVRVKDGKDVTAAFVAGAKECLRLVKLFGLEEAVLKSRSPSCGLRKPVGVTAAAILLAGVSVREL